MVGLSILLESQKNLEKSSQVINKISMIKSPLSPSSSSPSFYSSSPLPAITFLDACFLCKQELLPGKDIYMYKGDRAFCSIECRCRQIFMDEESVRKENCSFVAMKPKSSASSPQHRKRSKNRAGGFAF